MQELLKKLLESGVHFGHQTKRWNPKMKRFIFGQRSGIYIIDLEKTIKYLNQALDFVYDVASKGGKILFVGTKKQAQEVIASEAKRVGMYYINARWMGGLLTNFATVKKSIEKIKNFERMEAEGIWAKLTKKEVLLLNKEKDKLIHVLGGIREMGSPPAVVYIIDTKREEIAVSECNKLKIPVIGLIDTNCNPDCIDYPVPGNDDALKSIRLITSMIADKIQEGRKAFLTSDSVQKEIGAKESPVSKSNESSLEPEEVVESTQETIDQTGGKSTIE